MFYILKNDELRDCMYLKRDSSVKNAQKYIHTKALWLIVTLIDLYVDTPLIPFESYYKSPDCFIT